MNKVTYGEKVNYPVGKALLILAIDKGKEIISQAAENKIWREHFLLKSKNKNKSSRAIQESSRDEKRNFTHRRS